MSKDPNDIDGRATGAAVWITVAFYTTLQELVGGWTFPAVTAALALFHLMMLWWKTR